MLGIGMGEMVLIAGVALVVIGPEKFPEFAKICIRLFRDLRGYVDEAKSEFSKELKPLRKELDDLRRYNPEDYIDSLTGTEEDSAAGAGQTKETAKDPTEPTPKEDAPAESAQETDTTAAPEPAGIYPEDPGADFARGSEPESADAPPASSNDTPEEDDDEAKIPKPLDG